MFTLYVYNLIILTILFIFFLNYLLNNYLFKEISRYELDRKLLKDPPLISILVPARNEAYNIENCVRSLLTQDYPNFEIIVLDDNSTDETANIVKKICLESKRVKLIEGHPLERRWVGKNYACYQLEKKAGGRYLLFTDADTIHQKNSLSSAFSCLLKNKLDALSVYPFQITKTIGEKMVIRLLKLGILILIPLPVLKRSGKRLFSVALGSFMLYRREVYQKIGGHMSIYDRCLEDINMSCLLKKIGYKFMIFDGRKTYSVRMYDKFDDICKGFNRYLLASFDFNTLKGFLFVFLISLILLMPFLFTAFLLLLDLNSSYFYPILITNMLQIFILFLIRFIYMIRFKGDLLEIILHPSSIGIVLWIATSLNFNTKKLIYRLERT